MKAAGNRCEVVGFDGQKHGFFNPDRSGNKYFIETLRLTDRFLASLDLQGQPTIDNAMAARLPADRSEEKL